MKNAASLEEVWQIMAQIPAVNSKVLMYILTLLYKVSLVEGNNMHIANLCTCVAPNLVMPE